MMVRKSLIIENSQSKKGHNSKQTKSGLIARKNWVRINGH